MSITNTVLIFVVTPAVIILVITGLTLAGGGRRTRRYRPGRPYDFRPIWFLSSPGSMPTEGAGDPLLQPQGSSAVAGRGHQSALGSEAADGEPAGAAPAGRSAAHGPTGGASDRW